MIYLMIYLTIGSIIITWATLFIETFDEKPIYIKAIEYIINVILFPFVINNIIKAYKQKYS